MIKDVGRSFAVRLGVEDQLRERVRRSRVWSHAATRVVEAFGWSPGKTCLAVRHAGKYMNDAKTYSRQVGTKSPFRLTVRESFPILGEHVASAGVARGHYFHQDLWAARKIYERRPAHHVDVGSRIDGFVAHLLVFMPVTVVDVRPLADGVDGLHFVQSDATTLEGMPSDSIESLSSLHAIEHFGLGRYGDTVNAEAPIRVMAALARVLQPRGMLYLAVPVGRERVMFNAHRVFSPDTITSAMESLELVSFSGVNDEGRLVDDCSPSDFRRAEYACGLFEFTKIPGEGA